MLFALINYLFLQVQYVKDILPNHNGSNLIVCIGVASGLGRVFFGYIADKLPKHRILLQQIAYLAIGIFTMLFTAASYFPGFKFEALVFIALALGVFDGCLVALHGPIAVDLCGTAGAPQAIGFFLGMFSIPIAVGPLIAGNKSDITLQRFLCIM